MIALLLLCAAQAELGQLKIGMSEADASAILERAGAKVVHLAANEPQALKKALIDGELLAIWNRFELTPKTAEGGLDPAAFQRLLIAEAGDRRWVLTFGARGLRAALGRYPVRVDANVDPAGAWSGARLEPLRRSLKALGPFDLAPLESDTYGNRFAWKGRAKDAAVRALYRPADDELVVLLSAGG
jgi:hypothetical protein